MANSHRKSMRDQLVELRPLLDRQIMDRCRQVNQLAKTVQGQNAARLYQVKNQGLLQLVSRGDGCVKNDRQLGSEYLLIGLPGTGWLHSRIDCIGSLHNAKKEQGGSK